MQKFTRNPIERRARRWCAGVSMLELLVSLTLAIILMLSLVMLYLGAAKTAAREENISSSSRDGRLISRRLARDLRLVGLIAPLDLNGDSLNDDINTDVAGLDSSDGSADDFDYASSYELRFMGDIDNDDRTETVRLYLSGDTLFQEVWEWSRAAVAWQGPVRRLLGSNIDHVIFDYFADDGTRIPDIVGFPGGEIILSSGQRRRISTVDITLVLRSAMPENRIPEHLVLQDGTEFNDTYRRTVLQFMVRGRNLNLGA